MKKPPPEKLKKTILMLAYQKLEPIPSDEIKWSANKVAKILCLKVGTTLSVLNLFKREKDPALSIL
jgi:hypothetical protein